MGTRISSKIPVVLAIIAAVLAIRETGVRCRGLTSTCG